MTVFRMYKEERLEEDFLCVRLYNLLGFCVCWQYWVN